jgi:hypothetical protein
VWYIVHIYICKSQIAVQPLINVLPSNPCPISTSQTFVPQIYVPLFPHFFLIFIIYMIRLRSVSVLKSASTPQINIHWQNVRYKGILKSPFFPNSQIYGRLIDWGSIHVRFLRHRHLYLRSMSLFQILKSVLNSQIYVLFQILKSASKFSNLWPFLILG